MIALFVQLIAVLMRIKATAGKGGSGAAMGSVAPGSANASQLLDTVKQLNSTGISNLPGNLAKFATQCQIAQQKGQQGNDMAMLDAVMNGVGHLATDPKKLAEAFTMIQETVGLPDPRPETDPLGAKQPA